MIKTFKEDLNTAVFTIKYVLDKRSPILWIFHYEEDGSWQFSGEEEIISDEEYRVISLEEIINLDNSVLEVSDMQLEYMAYRDSVDHPWQIKRIE